MTQTDRLGGGGLNASFDPTLWIIAVKAASAAMTDESGLRALVRLTKDLEPWLGLDADQSPVCGQQDFTLIRGEHIVHEDRSLDIGGSNGRQWQPPKMPA